MKLKWVLAVLAMGLVLPAPEAARGGGGGFTPGHVFVSVHEADACDFGGLEAIVEIDPATGVASVFADSDDGVCLVNGLRFTPDGERLLTLNAGHLLPQNDHGWVQEFAQDGTSTVILDQFDGLARPFGANALAFDADGNLYVVNAEISTILRFPADGGPPTLFADWTDGIFGRGALEFAPNGDLFYAGDQAAGIIRITPDGESSLFDDPPGAQSSLVFDRAGNLFVGSSGWILRYDGGDAGSLRVLATGFEAFSGVPMPLILSPDGSVLYHLEMWGKLYAIDPGDGTTTVVTDLRDLLGDSMKVIAPVGITVFAREAIPATSQWGILLMALVVLAAGTLVLRRRAAPERHGLQTRATFSRDVHFGGRL